MRAASGYTHTSFFHFYDISKFHFIFFSSHDLLCCPSRASLEAATTSVWRRRRRRPLRDGILSLFQILFSKPMRSQFLLLKKRMQKKNQCRELYGMLDSV